MNYKKIEDNKVYDCIKCGKHEMREELVGNEEGGWVGTGRFICNESDCECSYKTDTDPEREKQDLLDEKIRLMSAN